MRIVRRQYGDSTVRPLVARSAPARLRGRSLACRSPLPARSQPVLQPTPARFPQPIALTYGLRGVRCMEQIGLGASDWDGCAAQRLPALRCHVLAVAAADEKPGGETAERMEAWGALVGPGARFETVTVPGGHLDMMQPAKGPTGPPPPIFELSLAGLQHVA